MGALVPQIPLRILPSHLCLAVTGQRSCYSCLYLASLDLLRAGKVCLARSLDTDTLASATGSLSSHLLPALPAQKVVVVPDYQPTWLELRWTQPSPSSRLPSPLPGYEELVGYCPQHLLYC